MPDMLAHGSRRFRCASCSVALLGVLWFCHLAVPKFAGTILEIGGPVHQGTFQFSMWLPLDSLWSCEAPAQILPAA